MPGIKHIFSDIRFWIILFFVLRLFAITDPPLEVAHNWRQATVTMVSRNFIETDANVLYPRIDIAGEESGITGMEFPFLNYLIYLISLVFGYAHWYGRLINLIVSSIGVWFFYKIISKYFTAGLAFNAAFMLLLSVWFTYSRKIMPDTFSMSLLFIGFYYGSNFLDTKNGFKSLALYFIFILLGILSKLPSAYIMVLFSLLIFNPKTGLKTKAVFITVTGIAMSIVSVYYFYWVPYLTEHFGFSHFFMGTGLKSGASEIMQHWNEALQKFYEESLGYSGFLLFAAGLFFIIVKKQKTALLIFALSFIGFAMVILKAGFAFYHHSYYIIPFAPIMALTAAFVFENIKSKKTVAVLLSLFLIEAIVSKNHDFYIKENNLAIAGLEKTLDSLGVRSDRIMINSGNVPTPMYFAHRKGWVDFNDKIASQDYIAGLRIKGLKFIVILKKVFGEEIGLSYPKVFENAHYCIYKIR